MPIFNSLNSYAKIYKSICLILLLQIAIVIPIELFAASPTRFYHLTPDNGLAHTDAICTIEDSEGFIWFGTNGGLQCYDGYQFITYDYYERSPKKSIRGLKNRVTSLTECGDIIYVGSNDGPGIFDKVKREYINYTIIGEGSQQLISASISSITVDNDDFIWIKATSGVYICKYNTSSNTLNILKSFQKNILDNTIAGLYNIYKANSGVWLVFRKRDIIHVEISENEINVLNKYNAPAVTERVNALLSSFKVDNKLYLRYSDGIIALNINKSNDNINIRTYNRLLFPKSVSNKASQTSMMAVDTNGNIWCAYNNGIFEIRDPFGTTPEYKTHSKSSYNQYSLSNEFISNIYVDTNNNVWIATWGGGVNYTRTTPLQFSLISQDPDNSNSLNDLFVKDMERDSNGYLWVATQNYGVDKFDFATQKVIETYPAPTELQHGRIIKSLKVSDSNRYIYVGSLDGLYEIDTKYKNIKIIIGDTPHAQVLQEKTHVYAIDIDKHGNIWLATWQDGVIVLKNNKGSLSLMQRIQEDSQGVKLSSNNVTNIKCDGDKVWASTNGGVNLIALDKHGTPIANRLYAADTENSCSMNNNFAACVEIESDSILWVGTLGGGLNRLSLLDSNKEQVKSIEIQKGEYRGQSITTMDGLPNNDVEIVMLDDDNNVWLAGGSGIIKLEYPLLKMTLFDFNDGLQSNTFKIGSASKDDNGTMYMGGTAGMNYFNPAHIRAGEESGKLVFSKFEIRDSKRDLNLKDISPQHINYLDNIELTHNQNDFTIEFSALSFYPTNKVVFRYKLEGLNENWIKSNKDYNRVSYANLDYGWYKFIVEASYNGGATWDVTHRRSLDVKINAPWWWSWWSRIIYLIILLSFISAIILQYKEQTKIRYQLALKDLDQKRDEENHQLRLQFFTNISHEFRTPLTIIMTAIENLQMNMDDDNHRSLVDSISRNANKLLSLITQLMDFRKTDTKRDVIHAVKEPINPYISDIAAEFELWADKKGITLGYSGAEDIEMWFDREKVSKIVWNLISNAIKYTDNGGEVFVSLNKMQYADINPSFNDTCRYENSENMDECAVLTVRDTGVGITADSLPKLFNRYFQVNSTTSIHLGSGIGLAVAKNMVLSHNGNIIVSSKRGEGTEFIVAIPIDDSYLSSENRFSSSTFDVNKYIDQEYMDCDMESTSVNTGNENEDIKEQDSLLIVEDNAELLAMLAKHFSSAYKVYTATNGVEGLDMVGKAHPDIIISDVMMPQMDGMEMCRHIRENLQTTSTPIILLTAKSEIENQIEGLESGADLYLSKPFTTKILDLQVRRFLAGKIHNQHSDSDKTDSTNTGDNISPTEDCNAQDTKTTRREEIIEQKDREFIDRLTQLILNNLDNGDYSVNSLCQDLAIGRTRLYAKIKEYTGQSLGDLIRNIRITRAAELLSTTDKNITEVIYEVGIGSNSHFSKAFKQRYGVTPSDYAKGIRKA